MDNELLSVMPLNLEDDIVLTGLSGRLPDSDSIEEFANQLFAGVDLVTADDRRWTPGLHGMPERSGKIKDLSHFDAAYFDLDAADANIIDPQLRLLLEVTHECIIDAGMNPTELRGSRTAVIVGINNIESQELWNDNPEEVIGSYFTSPCEAIIPNYVSHTFDFTGPSYALNAACAGSLYALVHGVKTVRSGDCDAAIVAGVQLCLKPTNTLTGHRLSLLSPEGRCAAFDASGNGFVRSEAVVAVLVQRRCNARRIYATVRGAGTNNDGYKEQGILYPDNNSQRQLFKETIRKANLQPKDITYVEAHSAGTKVGDPQEVNTIAEVYCKERTKPLLIGSVKSNMGHAEAAAGISSLAKVIIAMEHGVIPANLHYKHPNNDIPALRDGRIKVVDQNTPFEGGLLAINSYGFGGGNSQVILEPNSDGISTSDNLVSTRSALPRLVLASGRTKTGARALLKRAAAHAHHAPLHALIHAVHAHSIPGHPYRGYTLLLDTPVEEVVEVQGGDRRPMWWVFSGMGSQWPGMARSLLPLAPFANSVRRSAAVLRPLGIDLLALLTDAPAAAFDDITNSFVTIVAVQVALVDTLKHLGLKPDGIVGHSVGEVGCAYADGALLADQTVLIAYWCARCLAQTQHSAGAMASVGLTWEEATRRCPPGVEVACHNYENNVTVSGTAKDIEDFVRELRKDGIFARRVDSAGLAFHSSHVEAAAPRLLQSLLQIIPEPRPRSRRWISSSVPHNQWNTNLGRLSSAEYYVNNLLSPVRFHDALQHVPGDALVVELSPHALLQAVLKRALPRALHVPLVRKHYPCPLHHLLTAIGRIYCHGQQPQVGRLYPRVPWPVPRGTPGLASAVLWDHSSRWAVPSINAGSIENVFEYDLKRSEHSYISGYNIDGRIVFPVTGYLVFVWKMIAKLQSKTMEKTCVVFEDVEFKKTTIVTNEKPARFTVNILKGSGEFEICESGSVVVIGHVRSGTHSKQEWTTLPSFQSNAITDDSKLKSGDIYKDLHLRGYFYDGIFKGIREIEPCLTRGQLSWENNWVSFMDTMIQFSIVSDDTCELNLPVRLRSVVIDPGKQPEPGLVAIQMDRNIGVIKAGGVEMRGLETNTTIRQKKEQAPPKLERYVFVPYDVREGPYTEQEALAVCAQLAQEVSGATQLRVLEVAVGRTPDALLLPRLLPALKAEPQLRVDAVLATGPAPHPYTETLKPLGVKVIAKNGVTGPVVSEYQLVLCTGVLKAGAGSALAQLRAVLVPAGSLLLQEPRGTMDKPETRKFIAALNLDVVTRQSVGDKEFLLLKRHEDLPPERIVVDLDEADYAWMEKLRAALKRAESEAVRVYAVARAESSGVLGLATCLRAEPGGRALRAYFLPAATTAPDFAAPAPDLARQIALDLPVNVLRDGQWGCNRHLLLAKSTETEHANVDPLTLGDFKSLSWVVSPLALMANEDTPAIPGSQLCRVRYASVTLRDVMVATGKIKPYDNRWEISFGLDFSGHTWDGSKRVMGMVEARGLATSVVVDRDFVWEVPSGWSLEQAATVPVAYATAYYALAVRGRMAAGESVLVHAGSGGVGQAAIAISLHAGCTVYTTVDSEKKLAYLFKRFPQLSPANIVNTQNSSFEQVVLNGTDGRGVNLVLNSLAGEHLTASIRCLGVGGRFLEIGEENFFNNTTLELPSIAKNVTIHGIVFDALFKTSQCAERAAVVSAMTEGLAAGVVHPLPLTLFEHDQLEQAFRHTEVDGHIGKAVVRVPSNTVPALPRVYMQAACSYILVGGLDGFGLELAGWLCSRGARRLVLTSRSSVRTGYQAWRIRRWRKSGIKVVVSRVDSATVEGARELVREAAALGPVAGVYNLAAVLQDTLLENQPQETFCAAAKPKIDVTKALDVATRELAPQLQHFVMFSSITSGRGCAGQSNYGFANSSIERICECRRRDGLPALAIQWGVIGELDEFAEKNVNGVSGVDNHGNGTTAQSIISCLAVLDTMLSQPHPVVSSFVLADKHRESSAPQFQLRHSVANILGIKNVESVPESATLSELGMDSLMGSEIKLMLERHRLALSMQEVRRLTFARLREL